MATARDFITLALKEAGVLGVGQTPLAEDINDSFTLLNNMMSQWQKRRWLVPSLFDIGKIANGQKSNLIGPGQYYNAARPDKIQAAYFKQVNSGPNEVSYPLIPIFSYEDYALVQLKELGSWPIYFFYDGAYPFGNVFIWPIPNETYEVHLIIKSPIGFTTELEAGEIITGGAGYGNGVVPSVPFVNVSSFGTDGTADITVAGGIITQAVINDPGDGYKINDVLSVQNTLLGGTGVGFTWRVTDTTDDLDAEFNMPPEYNEAVHYNLCIRLTSMYQMAPNPVQGQLAKIALNTIKNANTQVPTLHMPSSLRFNDGNGFYIYNADAH